ncbi:hypothetical protein K501DRAFT_265083 [Backusella circina FSU 941]|nr:hypothetical protein K501DRAFT_265083 [Backusella circina FSU 941]
MDGGDNFFDKAGTCVHVHSDIDKASIPNIQKLIENMMPPYTNIDHSYYYMTTGFDHSLFLAAVGLFLKREIKLLRAQQFHQFGRLWYQKSRFTIPLLHRTMSWIRVTSSTLVQKSDISVHSIKSNCERKYIFRLFIIHITTIFS